MLDLLLEVPLSSTRVPKHKKLRVLLLILKSEVLDVTEDEAILSADFLPLDAHLVDLFVNGLYQLLVITDVFIELVGELFLRHLHHERVLSRDCVELLLFLLVVDVPRDVRSRVAIIRLRIVDR